MPQKNSHLNLELLEIPPTAARAALIANRIGQIAVLASTIVRRQRMPGTSSFGPRLFERFDMSTSGIEWSISMAERYSRDTPDNRRESLPVATYAPPQRQISSARQGAAEWDD